MAHGQMGERELEAAMVKFVDGQIDVLVSTAIVESGLDIPASNTIIINRADRFGLAQLYQLRGRVGRERQQAYAYLLIPPDGRLDETAQRRLRVIEEMTELGAGFRLAMRDLEIRGAGNLLGAAQHGHIAAVGFDLYTKLLAEAVRELKGEPRPARVDPVIAVDVEALLPETLRARGQPAARALPAAGRARRCEEIAQVRSELDRPLRAAPDRRARRSLEIVVAPRGWPAALHVERIDARGGRATLTFAPSTLGDARTHPGDHRAEPRSDDARRRSTRSRSRIPEGPWPAVRDALSGRARVAGVNRARRRLGGWR